MFKKLIPIIILFGAHATVRAQEGTTTYGLGAATCGVFGQEYSKNPKMTESIYFAWAEGFMSGLNTAAISTHLTYRRIDPGSAAMDNYMLTIRNYCDAHPLSAYAIAVTNLYINLPVDDRSP